MNNYSPTSNILLASSLFALIILYFVDFAIPERHDIIKFGYDTCFLTLVLGLALRQKYIQQFIVLFLYTIIYNLTLLSDSPFQLNSDSAIFHFDKHYSFIIYFAAFLFLMPTLFDSYKLPPLTNTVNIKDRTIILAVLGLTIILQVTTRLIY